MGEINIMNVYEINNCQRCCCEYREIPYATSKIFFMDFSDVINVPAQQGILSVKTHVEWKTPEKEIAENYEEEIREWDQNNLQANIFNERKIDGKQIIYDPIEENNVDIGLSQSDKRLYIALHPNRFYYSRLYNDIGKVDKYLGVYFKHGALNLKTIDTLINVTPVKIYDIRNSTNISLLVRVSPKTLINNMFRINATVEVMDCSCQKYTFTKCIDVKVVKC